MYSPARLALKYLQYYATAASGKGHGVHSPFVFDFIWKVLQGSTQQFAFTQVEQLRNRLRNDAQLLEVEDFGAGSFSQKTNTRKISAIARSSAKAAKYGRLLYYLVQHYNCRNIIELGTSLGISTSYLALANTGARVITCEGSAALAQKSRENFTQLGIENITVLTGEFSQTLPAALAEMPQPDLVFLDGNHRAEPTLHYFETILPHLHNESVLVFDDIHWSGEMETAWKQVQQHPAVSETIDVFFLGIAFFRTEQKVKQHFTIRY